MTVNFFAIFRKELRSYFLSPFIYIVSTVFLLLCGYYFYTDLTFYVQFGFGLDIMANFWQLLFTDLRLILLLVVPLLTMRLVAEEKKLGTIELLFTYPLRDAEVFLGKFAACAVAALFMLSFTIIYPIFIYSMQPFEWTMVIPGYVGLFLLALAFIACGLFVSSLTDNQVMAGFSALGILLFFWILSWNEGAVSSGLLSYVSRVALVSRFQGFAQGIIDSVDVVYFLLFVTFFSFLTLRSLESRKWRGRR
jgi:ABC-2 type transport system permease protein